MPTAQYAITHRTVSSCHLSRSNPPPEINPLAETPNALAIAALAKIPVRSPPVTPAKPCVYTTPERVVDVAERRHPAQVVERQIDDRAAIRPIAIAPQPLTKPAAGVIATSPVIMPLTPEIRLGLRPGRVVKADPDQEGDRRAEVRVQDRRRGVGVGQVRVAAVESVPPQPQQAGADRDHRQVVGRVDLAVTLQTRSDHRGGDEARHPGRHVDHVATREVERALLGEVAAAPDHERVDRVDQARPQQHERDPRLEVDPAQHRAEHQDRGDRREHELEVDERGLRERELSHVAEQGNRPLAQEI